jgi:hypothetical protein
MKFSKRQDIEAPIDVVFAAVSDFPGFERAALRRGIEVQRRDELDLPGPGMAWQARAPIRGRWRDIAIRLTGYDPATGLTLDVDSNGVFGAMAVELVALSRARTRVQVGLELKPATLTARLLIQSLKLAKASLDRRFARRVSDFAAEIESRQQRLSKSP